jgi:RHS repeat-associated protein
LIYSRQGGWKTWDEKRDRPEVPTGSGEPIDFPFQKDNDGFDSEVTFEDGKKKTYEIGKGWKSVYRNNKLLQRTYWANKGKNRIPIIIEARPDASGNPTEFTTVHYNPDLQVENVVHKYSDNTWQRVDTQPNTPWEQTANLAEIITANTTYTYNTDRLLEQISGYDTDMKFTYDANGNLLEANNRNIQKITKYTYYPDNNLEFIEYPDGKKTQFTYINGLLYEVINNDGSKTLIGRNARGEVQTVTDEENRIVTLERDIMGRLTKETSPSGRTVQYVWGGAGCSSCVSGDARLTKIIDSGINQWEFKYDIMGNVIELIYPDGSKIKQAYDSIGRVTSFTNKRDQQTIYQYDTDDRLIKETSPEGVTDYYYDDKDRLTEVSAPDYHYKYLYGTPGGYTGYTIVQIDDLDNNWWSQHHYNRFGFPTDYYDSFQWRKSIQYNFTQPLGTPIAPAPTKVSYFRWNSTQEHRINYYYNQGNRLYRKRNEYLTFKTEFSYNTNGRLENIHYDNFYGETFYPVIDMSFTRDDSGLIESITGFTGANDPTPDNYWSVEYNSDLEIKKVRRDLPFSLEENYTYDTRGNRLTSSITMTDTETRSFVYDTLNRLTSTDTHTYVYDADGNLTEEIDNDTGEKKKYFFNSQNRMYRYEHYANAAAPADTIATYTYDLYGRRIRKSVNGVVTHFFWEGDNMAMELDATYNPIRRYIYGIGKDEAEGYLDFNDLDPGDFQLDPNQKGWYSFIKDQVGTIYRVYSHYSQSRGLTERFFDSFGNPVNGSAITKGKLGFQSKYYDQESGLYYYYNRYYHPVNGRFLNEDPILCEGGLNFYNFTRNNPINYNDPFGLVPSCPDTEDCLKKEMKTNSGERKTKWCRDDKYSPKTHPGLTCYRSLGSVDGQQCCYDDAGYLGEPPSPDWISPAIGKNPDGSCKFSVFHWRFWAHVIVDVILAAPIHKTKLRGR